MKKNTIQDVLLRLVICEPSALETGCWEWDGGHFKDGYGLVKFRGRQRGVHCVVYEYFVGLIPKGKELHHRCENKGCANFEHVEPLTRKEHLHKGDTLAAREAKQTHCKYGHELEQRPGYKQRICMKCQVRRSREYLARKKERGG